MKPKIPLVCTLYPRRFVTSFRRRKNYPLTKRNADSKNDRILFRKSRKIPHYSYYHSLVHSIIILLHRDRREENEHIEIDCIYNVFIYLFQSQFVQFMHNIYINYNIL